MTATFLIILSCCVLVVVQGGVSGTADKSLTFSFQESAENLCLFTCSNCFDATDPALMVECANTLCLNALPQHKKLPYIWIKNCPELKDIWPQTSQ